MEVPLPFSKAGPVKLTGWHISGVRLLFLILMTVVVVQVWGDTLAFPKTLEKEVPAPIFSVSTDLEQQLEKDIIPDELRQGFRSEEVDLSENATVTTVEQGSRWLITDPSKKYAVIKEQNGLAINGEVLRDSLQFQKELETGIISEGLRKGFKSEGVGLSDNATVSTLEQGSVWLITDPIKEYAVTKEEKELIIKTLEKEVSTRIFSVSTDLEQGLENGTISEGLREGFRNIQIGLSDNATVSTLEQGSAWLITDLSKEYAVTKEENQLHIDELDEKDVFLNVDIADGVDEATDYVTRRGDFIFDRVADWISEFLRWLEGRLLWLPWPVLILGVALLAWRMAGLSVAFFGAIGLLLIGLVGLWPSAMETVSLMLTSVLISTAIAIPIGITAARNNTVDSITRPILDGMQTMPSFVYLVPAIFFFGLGNVPAVFATVIYAVPPAIRLTNLGIRQVSPETIEAAKAFGATPLQLLLKVQIPLALPTIMAGINQTTMLALSMVVVASLVGAGGLGEDVLRAIGRLEVGNSLLAGFGIVILAIIIDRMTQGFARAQAMATQE